MKCPNCNNEIPDDSKFCTACGSKVVLKMVSDLTANAAPMQNSEFEQPSFSSQQTPPQPMESTPPPTQEFGGGEPPVPPVPPISQKYEQPQQPQQPRYVTNTKPPKSCKACGGPIDPATKRCSNCGKPSSSVNGFLIGMIAACVVAVILGVVLVLKLGELSNAYATIDQQESSISTLSSQVAEYQEKADFLDANIVFIVEGDDYYYHTYDCSEFQAATSYYAMNTNLALYYGYIEDPYCH